MNYKGSKEICLALKKNIYKLNNHQRMQILLSVISEIPDSLSLIGQMGLIDPDRVRVLLAKGATGYTICQALLNMVEVKAPAILNVVHFHPKKYPTVLWDVF